MAETIRIGITSTGFGAAQVYIGRLAVASATVVMNPVKYLKIPLWSSSTAGCRPARPGHKSWT